MPSRHTTRREHTHAITRRDAVQSLTGGCLAVAGGVAPFGIPSIVRQDTEIVIRGGRVVNADGVRDADVRMVGESVAEVGASVTSGRGARIIDAAGKLVIPGGIDPHTHLHPSFVDDLTTGTSAAVAGGITTVGTFAFPQRGEAVEDALARVEAQIRTEAIGDVFLHTSSWPPTSDFASALPRLAERGQPSIKIYMVRRDFGEQLGNVIALLESARAAGVVTLIHCEDAAMLSAAVRRLVGAGRTTLRDYAASRPAIAEIVATQQAVGLCELTGAPMHVVHLSTERALDAVRNPHTASLPLTVETRPLYLYFTEEMFAQPDGALYVGQPPLRTPADTQALWRGLVDGRIDMLATDHAPWTRAQKLDPELSITRLRPGVSSLRFMLPLFYSRGVAERRIELPQFVAATSTNAAKAFGLYPQNGVIREGAQADIVVFDPQHERTVRAADDPSRADFTLYEGWDVTGWPVITIRRGSVVYEDGDVVGRPGTGRLATRQPRRV